MFPKNMCLTGEIYLCTSKIKLKCVRKTAITVPTTKQLLFSLKKFSYSITIKCPASCTLKLEINVIFRPALSALLAE